MNKSRKSGYCLNCNFSLKESDNFCPDCGQENRHRKVPLKTLILDFLGDYFTFDSKLFRSIFPLIFKPGFLTNEFNSGKRVKYIPPLRMYIFISILFFFIVGITKNSEEETEEQPAKISLGDTKALKGKKGAAFSMETGNLNVNFGAEEEIFTKELLQGALMNEKKLDEIFDSLKVEKTKFRKLIGRIIIAQTLKLQEQNESFSSYFLGNISIMMFFLMPLFAALLRLFYIRRKKFYIEHLTFSFHIHSFAFLILSVSEIFNESFVSFFAVLVILFYFFVALKKVYLQSFGKTIFKYFTSLFSYFICLTLCMLATIVVTFLFF